MILKIFLMKMKIIVKIIIKLKIYKNNDNKNG